MSFFASSASSSRIQPAPPFPAVFRLSFVARRVSRRSGFAGSSRSSSGTSVSWPRFLRSSRTLRGDAVVFRRSWPVNPLESNAFDVSASSVW